MPVVVLLPSGIVSVDATAWDINTGTFSSVLRGNDDTAAYAWRKLVGSSLRKVLEVTFDDLPAEAVTINSVIAGYRIDGDGTSADMALVLKEGGLTLEVLNTNPSSWQDFSTAVASPPTGGSWTPSKVNGTTARLEFGEPDASDPELRCTYAFLIVDYAAVPATPTNLVATAAGPGQINLTWTDNATNETSYKVQRCSGGGCTTYADVVTLAANVTSYSDTGLVPSTLYRYRVFAVNGAGNSTASNVAEATTQAASVATVALATATMLAPTIPSAVGVGVASFWMNPPYHAQAAQTAAGLGHGQPGLLTRLRRFADLMDASRADHRPLLEYAPGIELSAAAWLTYMGTTYKQFANYTIDQIVREVVGVEDDGVALVRVESITRCVNTKGTFFFNIDSAELYVHLADDTSPASSTMVALLGFWFATRGEVHPTFGADKLTNGDFETWV